MWALTGVGARRLTRGLLVCQPGLRQEERRQGFAVKFRAAASHFQCLGDGQHLKLQKFIRVAREGGGVEVGGKVKMHQFGAVAGGEVSLAEFDQFTGSHAGFLAQLAGGAHGGVFPGFHYAGGQFQQGPPGADAVDYFLNDVKEGYCDYYASAFTVMMPSVGGVSRTTKS